MGLALTSCQDSVLQKGVGWSKGYKASQNQVGVASFLMVWHLTPSSYWGLGGSPHPKLSLIKRVCIALCGGEEKWRGKTKSVIRYNIYVWKQENIYKIKNVSHESLYTITFQNHISELSLSALRRLELFFWLTGSSVQSFLCQCEANFPLSLAGGEKCTPSSFSSPTQTKQRGFGIASTS